MAERVYDRRQMVRYNRYRLTPPLDLPARTSWWLAWEASRQHMNLGQLVELILEFWADNRIAELTPEEARSYEASIPYVRGPYGPRRRSGGDQEADGAVPPAREETLPW